MAKTPEQREKNRLYMNRAYAENPEKFRTRSINWNRRHGILPKDPKMSKEENLRRNRENVRRYRAENPEKALESSTRANNKFYRNEPERVKRNKDNGRYRRRGLTAESYSAMVLAQNGACAICSDVPKTLCIDHNHTTDANRGLLCRNCNLAIGLLKDSPERAEALAIYLRRYQ